METTFVGHRPSRLGGFRDHNPARLMISAHVERILRVEMPTLVVCPLELGVGTWAAEVALSLKIPLRALLTEDQASGNPRGWSSTQKTRLSEIAARASEVAVSRDWRERDSALVERAKSREGKLFFFLLEEAVGSRTASTRRLAHDEGLSVVTVDPSEARSPAWAAASAMEALRGRLDERLLLLIGEAEDLVGQAARSGGGAKARHRLTELGQLKALVESLRNRI